MILPGSGALRYRLIEGAASVAPLRILATRNFDWQGWRVTARVLGASHALCLERAGVALTELFTCAPAPDEPEALLALDAPGCTQTTRGTLHVRVRVWQQPLGCPLPAPQLSIPFPIGPAGIAPLTQLAWATDTALRITTLHTYPEENKSMWTETTFTEIPI